MEKKYIIFAGVNGSGKSTFYREIQNKEINNMERVNSDEMLKADSGDWRNTADQMNAMRQAAIKIKECMEQGITFNQETTLTGHSVINNIVKAKEMGYKVELYYVGLQNVELAIDRVRGRVLNGGHGIEESDIRRRYDKSMENLKKVIGICDSVEIYDNTIFFVKIAAYKQGKNIYMKELDAKHWLKKCMGEDKHISNEKKHLENKKEIQRRKKKQRAKNELER